MSIAVTPEMIEAAARCRCIREGYNPDQPVHFERNARITMLRQPVKREWLGTLRSDGSRIEQWPTMPTWRWRYEAGAKEDLDAAFAVHVRMETETA